MKMHLVTSANAILKTYLNTKYEYDEMYLVIFKCLHQIHLVYICLQSQPSTGANRRKKNKGAFQKLN